MAHFAEIKSSDDTVLRVVVVGNSDVEANGGDYSTTAETWVTNNIVQDPIILAENGGNYPSTYWKQTSYNANARYNYAGPGSKWDSTNNAFIAPKPAEGFTLDSNYHWVAPQAYPSTQELDGVTLMLGWDVANQRWTGSKQDGTGNQHYWDDDNSVWVDSGTASSLI
tara:strand:- start:140 stop:640 length:501 start_codon:yes stop_codon:yes gene_type:complete